MTTKIPVELSSTPGIVDGSNATAITIDSSEDVTLAGHLVIADNKIVKFGAGTDLQIYHDASDSYIKDTGSGNLLIQGSDIYMGDTSNNHAFVIRATGNVGIGGGGTADTKLHLKDAGSIEVRLEADSNNNGQEDCFIRFYTDGKMQEGIVGMDNNNSSTLFNSNTENAMVFGCVSNLPVVFATNNTERMQITAAGLLCVNTGSAINLAHTFQTTNAGNNVAVFNNTVTSGNPYGVQLRYSGQGSGTGGDAYTYYTNSSGSYVLGFAVRATGNVVNVNNSYGQVSDRKLKENIIDATNKLDELKQIKIRNFNFIGDDTKQIGVIAQELETIFPALITDTEDVDVDGNELGTTTKEVKYSVLLPIVIKAMQEQQTIIEQLKADVQSLKGE